jgi:murein DD-endopeptidase
VPPAIKAIVSGGWGRPRRRRKPPIHRGLDLRVDVGTPVWAIDGGVVIRVQDDRSDAGIWVGIRHARGVVSRYLHLSATRVEVGQAVRRGDVVGLSGNTGRSEGPHLHLDLSVPGELLAELERVVGAPRGGWGAPTRIGYRIPAEPWVPVDGYLMRVKREAARDGIPLSSALRTESRR